MQYILQIDVRKTYALCIHMHVERDNIIVAYFQNSIILGF